MYHLKALRELIVNTNYLKQWLWKCVYPASDVMEPVPRPRETNISFPASTQACQMSDTAFFIQYKD